MPASENSDNKFKRWIIKNEKELLIKAYDEKNHEQILSHWPESKELHDSFLEQIKENAVKMDKDINNFDAYRLLV